MEKLKRYQDIEDIIYDMMDSGLEASNGLEVKNEYHSDGASDYVAQDIVLIVKNSNGSIITDEILMTREVYKKDLNYSIMDKDATKEIKEIKEIIDGLIG